MEITNVIGRIKTKINAMFHNVMPVNQKYKNNNAFQSSKNASHKQLVVISVLQNKNVSHNQLVVISVLQNKNVSHNQFVVISVLKTNVK